MMRYNCKGGLNSFSRGNKLLRAGQGSPVLHWFGLKPDVLNRTLITVCEFVWCGTSPDHWRSAGSFVCVRKVTLKGNSECRVGERMCLLSGQFIIIMSFRSVYFTPPYCSSFMFMRSWQTCHISFISFTLICSAVRSSKYIIFDSTLWFIWIESCKRIYVLPWRETLNCVSAPWLHVVAYLVIICIHTAQNH